jgi:hypothetical protein
VHPPPSPARTNFTLITECTPESSGCNSVYSACGQDHGQDSPFNKTYSMWVTLHVQYRVSHISVSLCVLRCGRRAGGWGGVEALVDLPMGFCPNPHQKYRQYCTPHIYIEKRRGGGKDKVDVRGVCICRGRVS